MSYTISRGGYFCAECAEELTREGTQRCTKNGDHVGREWYEDGIGVEVDVYVRLSAVDPGRYSGPPEDCYPAEGGEVLDSSITIGKGVELRLAEEDELVEEAQEDELNNPPEPDYPDYDDGGVDDWLS